MVIMFKALDVLYILSLRLILDSEMQNELDVVILMT